MVWLYLKILPGPHHWLNSLFWDIFETLFITKLSMGHVFGTSTVYIKTISQQFDQKKGLVSGLLFSLQTFQHQIDLTLNGNLFALYSCAYRVPFETEVTATFFYTKMAI